MSYKFIFLLLRKKARIKSGYIIRCSVRQTRNDKERIFALKQNLCNTNSFSIKRLVKLFCSGEFH